MKTVSEVLLLSAVALSAATVRVMPSQVQADPAYPDGFREWALVKSAVIVATHPVSRPKPGSIASMRTRLRAAAMGRAHFRMALSLCTNC